MNSPKTSSYSKVNIPFWIGMSLTLAMVVIVRESSVWVCQQFGIATAGNIVGLVVMFIILINWRMLRQKLASKSASSSNLSSDNESSSNNKVSDKKNDKKIPHLPHWLTESSNKLLIDSGFAFLPVSAGGGLLLLGLGDEMWAVIITLIVSTLVPMWALAKLGDIWLREKQV